LQDPSSKKKHTKRVGGVAQVVESLPSKCETEFKPQYHQKKKLKNKNKKQMGRGEKDLFKNTFPRLFLSGLVFA
jgi:hypothetical protein